MRAVGRVQRDLAEILEKVLVVRAYLDDDGTVESKDSSLPSLGGRRKVELDRSEEDRDPSESC